MHCVASYRVGSHAAAGPKLLRRSFCVSYLVVILKYRSSFNAYYPDVPGCVALSSDLGTVRDNIVKGLELHLTFMVKAGKPLPEAHTTEVTDLEAEEQLIEVGVVEVRGRA